MVEKIQAGSTMQPETHLQDVNGAIAAAQKANPAAAALAGPGSGGSGGSSEADPVVDAIVTSPFKTVNAAVALADGFTGGKSQSDPNNKGGTSSSHFVSGTQQHTRPMATPLVPMGYREMVEAAKRARRLAAKLKPNGKPAGKSIDGGNVFGRVATAGLSLTGGSLSDSASSGGVGGQKRNGIPITGLVVSAKAAAGVAVLTKLFKEKATTLKVMAGVRRYKNNPLLLAEDLKGGSTRAKQAIKRSPAIRPRAAT